jgi:hypothetical protein
MKKTIGNLSDWATKIGDWIFKMSDKSLEYLLVLLGSIGVFLQPVKGLFILTLLFLVADTVFAIYVNKKTRGGWGWYRSRRLADILTKGIRYAVAIAVSHAIDIYVLKDSLFFGIPPLGAKAATFVILYIETKSIDEKRVKLGLKSFFVMIKEWIDKGKRAKEDINDLI